MYSRLLTVLLLLLTLSLSLFAWETVPGPTPEYTDLLTGSGGYRMVAALREGGVWRSDDWGSTWTPLNTTITDGTMAHVRLVNHLTPIDGDLDSMLVEALFEPTQDFTFCATSFFGYDWHPLQTGNQHDRIQTVIGDWANLDHLMGIQNQTIFNSWEFGQTWHELQFPLNPMVLSDFTQDPQAEQTYYVTLTDVDVLETSALMVSTDRCSTWTEMMAVDTLIGWNYTFLNGPYFLRSGSMLMTSAFATNDIFSNETSGQNYFFRSEDGGASWSTYADVLPSALGAVSMVQDPVSNRVYAWNGGGRGIGSGLYESLDDGYSFQRVTNGLPADLNRVDKIEVNPSLGQVYLLSSTHGVYFTTDGGESWSEFGTLLDLGKSMNFIVQEDRILAQSVQDLASYIYDIGSEEWSRIPARPSTADTVRSMLPILLEDEDRTISFEVGTTLDGSNFSYLQPLISTTDHPESHPVYSPLVTNEQSEFSLPYLSLYQDETSSRIVLSRLLDDETYTYSVDVTADSGRSWSTTVDWPSFPQFCQGTGAIYTILREIGVYRSTDNGVTWDELGWPEGEELDGQLCAEINPVNGAFYLFTNDHLLRYQNESWTTMGGYSDRSLCSVLIPGAPPRFVRIVDRSFNIPYMAASDNGGASWSTFAIDQMTPGYGDQYCTIQDIQYDPWRDQLWFSTPIGLMHTDTNFIVGVEEEDVPGLPDTPLLVDAWPNPFNATTRITITLDRPGHVRLKVFDLQGREVTSLLDETRTAGEFSLTVDADDWPSGTYFLRLQTDAGEVTRKLALVK